MLQALEGLPQGALAIDGRIVPARIAATPEARAQGFQGASPEAIARERIYFSWPSPRRPAFHMHNVPAPLAIAWIGPQQRVIAVERMAPERAGYRPPAPVSAALELSPAEAERLEITPGVTIRPAAAPGAAGE
ncbi:DUF192 domain-containing protein [Halorhodospira neutriphila]|nr:DUF192 domain-containing protein [Halorhodospira neutriphila]